MMKAEYLDDRDATDANNMFTKFHHHHHQQQQQQQKFHLPPPSVHHPNPLYHPHFNLPRESQTSEEADSGSGAAGTTTTTDIVAVTAATPPAKKARTVSEDGATIEVVRRPRGRPPGSKNKPKPPVVITRELDPGMAPYILEVQGGMDIVESLTRYTRRRNVGLCVLNATGSAANVTLRQPASAGAAGTVTFHGRFDILSLSAVLLGDGGGVGGLGGYGGNGVFTISLGGPQGQIIGGKVVGALIAAGTVYVVAGSFNNPTFHRLPVDSEEIHHHSVSTGGAGGSDRLTNSPGVSGGSGDGEGVEGGNGGGGENIGSLGMYGCHLGSDVLWPPTARPPSHHPHQPY